MEKEMKKLLLVAVSVGVFLLVTITVAIVLLTPPKVHTEGTAFSSSHPYPVGRTQPTAEITRDINPQPEFTREPIVDIRQEDAAIVTITGDRNNGDHVTINVPRPSTAAVPDVSRTPPVSTAPAASTRPAAAATPAARPAAAATAPATATRQAAPARTINDYWVQTGAFSAMVRAEDAKELLASKGIISIIENRIVDGRIWYRVRLGPYTSENEANYWLALVKTIDGFGESQVRQTVRQQ